MPIVNGQPVNVPDSQDSPAPQSLISLVTATERIELFTLDGRQGKFVKIKPTDAAGVPGIVQGKTVTEKDGTTTEKYSFFAPYSG